MGVHVEECKLRVVYVSTPQLPSTVPEEREKSLSPQPSVLDTENSNGYDVAAVSICDIKLLASVLCCPHPHHPLQKTDKTRKTCSPAVCM